ncbi:1-deoxy-D-xylulose-5-phosphate reductoisomerase [Pontimonas salivibrio]|uniref:1-deoxy-D-xylulose 5-phosphate reductoisomerase n=1 Tax=Pontimonas salivibrio TaxID=1159327 RepID=A0A2L2BPM8_9MICO|nr:1-deoxy-D-xylulose-5-phosphate reductoisomerase [Pontimonas salivibrio]AVG23604.1 1-deoxy-D-xylulose-5-phosphate reductoisomerase [Pontimonas salivibrio]
MRRVLILGSTGSIGTQAIDIATAHPERFSIVGLSAGSKAEMLAHQAQQLGLPESATALGAEGASDLIKRLEPDVVLNAITGSVGLGPTLVALDSGAVLALANKESLIVGGQLVTSRAQEGQIVPVDSEHSALAQALMAGKSSEVNRLIVTASGGPFRGRSAKELEAVSPGDALAHPTWNMGRVITTNSATLVNKGLEVIEAHLLFGIDYDHIEVTVHPQSIVHSLVEFIDGSTMAQCSPPDMRLPISLALEWPKRVPGAVAGLDWTAAHTWTFEPLDDDVFPAVSMAKAAGIKGATFPAVFNAANEQAVDAFHDGALSFPGITQVIAEVLGEHQPEPMTLEGVYAAEAWARSRADEVIATRRF